MSVDNFEELEEDFDEITLPPHAAEDNGYVYVLEFTNGTIKVGQAVDIAARLRSHVSDAEAFNIGADRIWYSTEHRFYDQSERLLIAQTAAIATGRHRKEYFTGVTYEQVRDLARVITEDEISRRMSSAFRLCDEGMHAAAVEMVCGIGMDFATGMAVIDFYRGGDFSESVVVA